METTKQTSELKRVYHIDSFGGNGTFKMEIYIGVDRELNETDKDNIAICANVLNNQIQKESVRLNPKLQAEAAEEKAQILGLFKEHGIFSEEIPNGYDPNSYLNPWFVITTNIGRIKIGWRKRVINIDWSDTLNHTLAEGLFPNEDVTKFNRSIHAYGYEKAQEYINTILTPNTK